MVGDTHHTGERTKMYLIFFKFKGIFVITQAANIHFMVFSVSLPILSEVLKFCVTDTNEQ